ncbi:peptidylprolyl isomerase [Amycolatopsis anabasis]|uniref:peptidylprolyl isomerase n=1 Tax=Amycolatopsis anabasis TaxID=1840409 RepID=UPI00131D3C81|nr:peptidylprolyl isomerase [Amycolatopsis anabasis]
MKLRWSILTATAALALTVPVGAAQAAEQPSAQGRPYLTRCEFTPTPENPAAKPVHPPLPWAFNRGTVRATIETNYGDVRLKLDRANAPCAVHNLVHLARHRFYHRTQCFRLTNSARLGVLQCGDIHSVEKGGPGYKFADEVTGKETYPRGTIAMGNQGPGTNGSQFFIVHSFANIKPMYTVLGQVTRGMEVLDRIVANGIIPGDNGEQDGLPAKPVKIHRIVVR